MKYILGISCFFHDSSACIIKENEIIAAAEEERFTRIKHDNSFPQNAIKFCLDKTQINSIDLDAIVFYENPVVKFDRVAKTLIKNFPKSLNIIKSVAKDWHSDKLWFKEKCKKYLDINKKKIFFFDHHKSHLYSALIPSNFKQSACLTIDGVGEWATTEGSIFKNNSIEKVFSVNFPNSLGILYSALTEFLGFEVNEGEYKVMGLAAYGEPIHCDKIEKLFNFRNKDGFELNMEYFSFEYSMKTNLTEKFYNLFGQKREAESEFLKKEQEHPKLFELNPYQKYYADIAASLQLVMQDQILLFVKNLKKTSGLDNLVYAGGVAYNGVINEQILKTSGFKNIFIQPAAGDNGAAIGAALGFKFEQKKYSENFIFKNMYLGKSYTSEECLREIENFSFEHKIYNNIEAQANFLASHIFDEKIVGFFRSSFEFGPRALGNRSIIAHPGKIQIKNKINKSVKFREQFRPFAPIVLDKWAETYFEINQNAGLQQPYKFMLAVAKTKDEYVDKLQAITHVDGTARIQILSENDNNLLYNVIKKFGELSGIYCLVNTSFNIRGEPMVGSPYDALKTFSYTDLDILSLENIILKK